jgi:hypothetical protein
MKRVDLIKTIEEFECILIRHGAKHDWYRNPNTGVSHLFRVTAKSRSIWRVTSFECCATLTLTKTVENPRKEGRTKR